MCPSDHPEVFAAMGKAIIDGDQAVAISLAQQAVDDGLDLVAVIEDGFSPGIQEVGRQWEGGECFLPELMRSAQVMKAAMAVIIPHLAGDVGDTNTNGTVIIGTIQGDIHDIGKTIVATMLTAYRFKVEDLGTDVAIEDFVARVKAGGVDVVAMSALLTTTMTGARTVIERLEAEGLRSGVKVVVGGAPVTRTWADEIGADGYGEDAMSAVATVKKLLGTPA